MRITLLAPVASGAMGQSVTCLAAALEREGGAVTLIVPAHFRPSIEFRGKVVLLPTPTNRASRAFYWYNPFALEEIRHILKATRPDLIHLYNAQGYLPSLALPWISEGAPIVVTVHDPVAHSGAYADHIQYGAARRLLLPRVSGIHTMSEYGLRLLIAQGFSPMKLLATRHGALTEVFIRHNRPETVRGDSLLFFGRWEAYKGIDLLVQAVVELAGRGVRQHCILAGPGRLDDASVETIKNHPELFEVHNRYLADEEVAVLFQRANRSVLPYRDATQSSLPALAQAYGHVVIATRVGSFPEEVEIQGGILVEPSSVSSLAEGIERSRGVSRAQGAGIDYSWKRVAEQLIELYERILRHKQS